MLTISHCNSYLRRLGDFPAGTGAN